MATSNKIKTHRIFDVFVQNWLFVNLVKKTFTNVVLVAKRFL